jgi:hypothetical protein
LKQYTLSGKQTPETAGEGMGFRGVSEAKPNKQQALQQLTVKHSEADVMMQQAFENIFTFQLYRQTTFEIY